MEELWRRAKRLSKLASGPSTGVRVPNSAALTWGKLGPALIESAGFHRVSRGAKIPMQPHAQSGFYLIPLHSQQRHCNPSLPRKKPTLPLQPRGKQPWVPCAKCHLAGTCLGRRLTRLCVQSPGWARELCASQPALSNHPSRAHCHCPGKAQHSPSHSTLCFARPSLPLSHPCLPPALPHRLQKVPVGPLLPAARSCFPYNTAATAERKRPMPSPHIQLGEPRPDPPRGMQETSGFQP